MADHERLGSRTCLFAEHNDNRDKQLHAHSAALHRCLLHNNLCIINIGIIHICIIHIGLNYNLLISLHLHIIHHYPHLSHIAINIRLTHIPLNYNLLISLHIPLHLSLLHLSLLHFCLDHLSCHSL